VKFCYQNSPDYRLLLLLDGPFIYRAPRITTPRGLIDNQRVPKRIQESIFTLFVWRPTPIETNTGISTGNDVTMDAELETDHTQPLRAPMSLTIGISETISAAHLDATPQPIQKPELVTAFGQGLLFAYANGVA